MQNRVESAEKSNEAELEKDAIIQKLTKIAKNTPVEEIRRLCCLSFTIRTGISPIHYMMSICGLSYGSPCPLVTHIGRKYKIKRAYTIFIALVMLAALLRMLPFLFQETSCPKFIKYEYFLWTLKCVVQSYFCFWISCRYGRKISRLQELLSDYDLQVQRYQAAYSQRAKCQYKRKCKIMKFVLYAATILMIGTVFINAFLPVFEKLNGCFYQPFTKPDLIIKLIFVTGHCYLVVAWVLPVVLYCAVCLSLCLIFDQFLSSLSKFECNQINKRIEYIREEYHMLQRLVERTDETFGFMTFCVYSLDVLLSCFHLYHLCYFATSPLAAVSPAYRVAVSVGNLFFTSFCASNLVDKGQRISNYVASMSAENVDLESHAKLVMLLHEITINPIALTIWKLVPLYKSIVISVFVSLITYFTLLIQFKS